MTLRIVHAFTDAQVDELVGFFADLWWTAPRPRDGVVAMLAGSSLNFGVVNERDELLGYARLLTDFAYRGTLYDVIVRPDQRGIGVGRFLLDAIVGHPRVAPIQRISLTCHEDKLGLYERWGWRRTDADEILMARRVPE